MLAFSMAWYGCATPSDANRNADSTPRTEPAATVIDARPAALIDGRSLMWGDVRVKLSEAAGGEVLREIILERAIDKALDNADMTISSDDLARERRLLLETLSDDPDVALRLLDELRVRQGLGPARFNALMYRNAALRALVKDQVQITEASARRMHEITYGTRRQARLMILPTLGAAQHAIDRVHGGQFFGDVAVEISTDASASRGGLLEPISRADSSYPEALRSALWALQPGELSSPILLNDQYAVLMFIDEIEGEDVAFDDVRDEMHRLARLQRERMLMDQLARDLVRNVSVTIFDDALNESWRMMRRNRR